MALLDPRLVSVAALLVGASIPMLAQSNGEVLLTIDTTKTTPLNQGFSGANFAVADTPELYDTNFAQVAASIAPGWLRFPAGTRSDAFNWQTGQMVQAWVDEVKAVRANSGEALQSGLSILAGKGGASFSDFAAMLSYIGTPRAVVCVNAFTDTPASAGAMAAYAKAHNIQVGAWELSNEPYLFDGANGFFTNAADYAAKMKPFRDAIKAADPNAVVALFFSDAGNQTPAWDNALSKYSDQYWDAVVYHDYPPTGTETTFADVMARQNGYLVSATAERVATYLVPRTKPGTRYLVTEFDPELVENAPSGSIVTSGTLYSGIYTAEYIVRLSPVPSMLFVGWHQLYSPPYGILSLSDYGNQVRAAYNSGTTIDTSQLDFGFYMSPQAAAMSVANSVLSRATQVASTSLTGSVSVAATGIGTIPAVYAQGYLDGQGRQYAVITNKSAISQTVRIQVNGADVQGSVLMVSIFGADPSAKNTNANPYAVTPSTKVTSNPVLIPAYSVVALSFYGASATITAVNTASGGPDIAQNTFIEIKGINLVPASTASNGVIWSDAPEFASGRMPTKLHGVSVTVNGKPAYVYFYCSTVTDPSCATDQINVLTPLDATVGKVQVVVTNSVGSTPPFTANMKAVAPTFLLFTSQGYVVATHADFSLLGPVTLFPGSTPAKRGEPILLYAVGFGLPTIALTAGSSTQSGSLPAFPVCRLGGASAPVTFAGLVDPGLYAIALTVPASASSGDNLLRCTYDGVTIPVGNRITVQ